MDIPFGGQEASKFAGIVGLITTTGPVGDNIVACEWTRLISYSPGIVAVSLHLPDASTQNIKATKEFAVGIAAVDQALLSSLAGSSSGRQFNKIEAAKELGFTFKPATLVKAFLVDGAALNLECRVTEEHPQGDHVTFFANVIAAATGDKAPLIYHQGQYWMLGENIPKPTDEVRAHIKEVLAKHPRIT